MRANELRLGNWVAVDKYLHKVSSITNIGVDVFAEPNGSINHGYNLDELKPEPLTEELLLKCEIPDWLRVEFIKDEINGNYFIVSVGEQHPDGGYMFYALPKKYKYIHSFQNLYFALTGSEL